MYIEEIIWKNYLDGNEELFNLIGKSFLESYKEFEKEIVNLIEINDVDTIHEKLHSIKGIALNLGMEKLDTACETALVPIRKNIIDKDCLNQLILIFKETYRELEKLIN